MRVLFIYTDISTNVYLHIQHGIGYLSSVLEQGGHLTLLLFEE